MRGMPWFSSSTDSGLRKRKQITEARSLEIALQRAASLVGADLLVHQAEALAEAAGIWASGWVTVRYAADRRMWEMDGFRDHVRQEMRWKLLDKITREGHVPVSLPAEKLYRTRFMPFQREPDADDTPVPSFSMPEDSDWDQVAIVLEVGIRTPEVDRRAAVKTGILNGEGWPG
jgi:hypothetical protein